MSAPPAPSAPIEWLFIDVGGVLFDDTPLLDALYHYFSDGLTRLGTPTSLEDILATRQRFIQAGEDRVYQKVLRHHTASDTQATQLLQEFRTWLAPRQAELNPLIDGVPDALKRLGGRYHLALAANQGAYVRTLLAQRGIEEPFRGMVLSGEIGIAKPDPRFFQALFDHTGSTPATAVMVGDSLANDLRPAHALGLRTVRVVAGGDNLRDERAYGFVTGTVSSLAALPGLLDRWQTISSS